MSEGRTRVLTCANCGATEERMHDLGSYMVDLVPRNGAPGWTYCLPCTNAMVWWISQVGAEWGVPERQRVPDPRQDEA